MPIIEENGEIIVQFGTGDILLACGEPSYTDLSQEVILIATDEPGEVGKKMSKEEFSPWAGKLTTETPGKKIRLQFNDVRSILALIERLSLTGLDLENA